MGHDAISALALGDGETPDAVLIDLAIAEGRVIVTEDAKDFAHVRTCTIVILRKVWWSRRSLTRDVSMALLRWAEANPNPDRSAIWLDAEFR
jgi:predicted nuclease of predicted toxin-antitoxin system